MKYWLTVITVVKDAPDAFVKTTESLKNQDMTGVEFVVIDGSVDHEGIPRNIDQSQLATAYHWVAPSGIYSAMNVGVEVAHGEYVYFANAGDEILPETFARIKEIAAATHPRWIIAPVEISYPHRETVVTPTWDFGEEERHLFARGHFPAHQGTFVRKAELTAISGFDESFTIAADYHAALRLSLDGPPMVVDFPVARFHEGGISTVRRRDSFHEFHRARQEVFRPQGFAWLRERWYTQRQIALDRLLTATRAIGIRGRS